jgi:ANTAR domain
MSKKRHRARSRALDPAAGAGRPPGEAGQDWPELPGALSASARPGVRTPSPDPSGVRSPASGSGAGPSGLGTSGIALSGAPPLPGQDAVVRRTPDGWRVGDDELPDLTCAMVLADLLAAELPTDIQPAVPPAPPAAQPDQVPADRTGGRRPPRGKPAAQQPTMEDEAHRLRITVGQLEHALTARIRVEQAIGVLAERHRIRPRQAFEQLRSAARNRGRRVIDIATDVVASATNPLLQLPEELSRQRSAPRHGGRHSRRALRPE